MKKAIITGITGQDGAYLTKLLLEKGYQVFGTYRRSSSVNFWRLEELGVAQHKNLELIEYDLTDEGTSMRMISSIVPDEVYNLAAQSFVAVSFEQPITTAQITGVGCLNLLEAIRTVNPKVKYYQASTSELYGKVIEVPQNEKTPFYPRSPYAVSKLFAHWMTVNYRESYGLFACSGILLTMKALRGIEFVTRKITDAVAKYKQNGSEVLELGNIDAQRDWGYAQDYVEGMYLMLQQSDPIDFVLATGKTHSVRDFVELAFAEIGVNIRWQGKDIAEQGVDDITGHVVVKINPKFYRPTEVDLLIGNPSLAKSKLGWTSKTNLKDLCSLMVRTDIERLQSS